VWSAGFQRLESSLIVTRWNSSEDRVENCAPRRKHATTLEVAVSPESDAEVRRVSLSNLGNRVRDIELTSYAKVVLTQPASDMTQPSFSKLLSKQSSWLTSVLFLHTASSVARRARNLGGSSCGHRGDSVGGVQYETDRARFLGRGHKIRSPISVMDGRPLSSRLEPCSTRFLAFAAECKYLPEPLCGSAFWTIGRTVAAEKCSIWLTSITTDCF